MQRREFLRTSVGAAAAAIPAIGRGSSSLTEETGPPWLPRYEETLAASTDLELLGIPRSWWSVRHGLHPFSPERTLIIPDCPQRHRPECRRGDIDSLARRIKGDLDEDATPHTEPGIHQLIYAAFILTQTYRVSDELDAWSKRMANWLFRFYGYICARDHFWINPMGWQGDGETVKTMNGVVDWWLLLIPGGIDVRNFDGTRTHVLITPVFSRFSILGFGSPRFYGDFFNFMAKALRHPFKSGPENHPIDPTWLRVSRMDRKSACLFVNRRIAHALTECS
jgi:hypothetical protein